MVGTTLHLITIKTKPQSAQGWAAPRRACSRASPVHCGRGATSGACVAQKMPAATSAAATAASGSVVYAVMQMGIARRDMVACSDARNSSWTPATKTRRTIRLHSEQIASHHGTMPACWVALRLVLNPDNVGTSTRRLQGSPLALPSCAYLAGRRSGRSPDW